MKKEFNLENASNVLARIYLEGREEKAIIDSLKFIARMCNSGASYRCIDKFCHMMTDKGVKLLLSSREERDFFTYDLGYGMPRLRYFVRNIAQVSVPEEYRILDISGIDLSIPEYTVENTVYLGVCSFRTCEIEFEEEGGAVNEII